jgi:hypothetical protein
MHPSGPELSAIRRLGVEILARTPAAIIYVIGLGASPSEIVCDLTLASSTRFLNVLFNDLARRGLTSGIYIASQPLVVIV